MTNKSVGNVSVLSYTRYLTLLFYYSNSFASIFAFTCGACFSNAEIINFTNKNI